MEKLVPALSILLVQLPVILVWLVGLVLSLIYWQRHPKVSRLALIALIGFLIIEVIGSYVSIWLPLTLHERGLAASQIGIILFVRGIFSSLVSAILWGLLVAAIFGWRGNTHGEQQHNSENPTDQP
jgi:hypothetical protein